jgi:peptidoglycan-associated lipoprotein
MRKSRELIVVTVATICILGAGCAKKRVAAAPSTPPAPAAQPANTAPPAVAHSAPAAVTQAAPAAARSNYPDAATRARIDQLLSRIEDAYFDYDKHTLRADAIKALESDSKELRDILKDYPDYKLTIEGHADERGSAEYNMALGQARAEAAKSYLVQVGIPGQQLGVISYGKEKPDCQDHSESCWQKNRRVHIVAVAQK